MMQTRGASCQSLEAPHTSISTTSKPQGMRHGAKETAMITTALITIGSKPDVRTTLMGTAPCISAAPASARCQAPNG